MPEHDLDRAFKKTPPQFSHQLQSTLAALQDSKPRRLIKRGVVILAAVLLSLSGIVYAAIQLGHEWYYQTQLSLYKVYYPENYQAILKHLVRDVPQQATGPAAAIVDLKVQDYAWVTDRGLASFSFTGRLRDTSRAELYSLWEIDLDGAQVGVIDPEDPESRLEHYLRTPKGFGPPREVMQDPSKQLLLLDFDQPLYIGDSLHILERTRSHIFTTDESPVMQVEEINLHEQSEEILAIIRRHTNEHGLLRLRLPFAVVPFADNDFGKRIPGELVFTVKITE